MSHGTQPRPRASRVLGGAVLAVCLLGGCSTTHYGPINAGSALVFEHPAVVEWSRGERGTPVQNRFEFARHDRARQIVEPAPLLATRQWPEPHAPRERRVRFRYWEQR